MTCLHNIECATFGARGELNANNRRKVPDVQVWGYSFSLKSMRMDIFRCHALGWVVYVL